MSRLAAPYRFLPLLVLLFAGSGCAALIYEIVWFQLLQLVLGSSAISLGVLLGTFMGGMCLGSAGLSRMVSASRHPLRVYALLEVGIGLSGLVVLLAVPLIDRAYVAVVGHGLPAILLRGLVAAIVLLPPTVLMGATLPAIARWVEATPQGVSWLGFFYGGNIAGAVLGSLLAGFYLLRVHDTAVATAVAMSLNFAVAVIAWALARRAKHETAHPATKETAGSAPHAWAVYVTIALSGLCALGSEVIWTRLLSLMLGATVYTFSIILAVFLVGLGIGSSAGSVIARGAGSPRIALGLAQMLAAASIAWTAYMLGVSLPYWPVNPLLSTDVWIGFHLDLARCFWAIFPATLLWGASFPLALASVAERGQDPGRLVGRVYAANTVGAILGAIGFTMLVVPSAGTQQSQRALIALATTAALLMFGTALRRKPAIAAAVALTACAAGLSWFVPVVPWGAIAHGRRLPSTIGHAEVLYVAEGMNASVAISKWEDGKTFFHVSGKVEASGEPHDMRLQRMLGHIPALLHPNPRSILVVGCGAGVTAGSFVVHPEVERILICEIEPLIPRVSSKYFTKENHNVVNDRRTRLVFDDARHYILTTRETFDVITSDPIHPWVKGAATLYSKEYFELCKRRLTSDGIMTQWVPLYESDEETVKSEIATFFEVFPNGTIWGNELMGEGYDVVLMGHARDRKIDIDELQRRLERPDHHRVRESLSEVAFHSALDLFSTYAGQARDLHPWLAGAEINRDRSLRLQYLAGMGLNANRAELIYDQMLRYRRFPENLFKASVPTRETLRAALGLH
jgi:spermidine synthase